MISGPPVLFRAGVFTATCKRQVTVSAVRAGKPGGGNTSAAYNAFFIERFVSVD